MAEFAVYVETLKSVSDKTKNTRTKNPVGKVDLNFKRENETLADYARRKFDLKANEQPYFIKLPTRKIHAQCPRRAALSLCQSVIFHDWFKNFPVTCKKCLKLIEKDGNENGQ